MVPFGIKVNKWMLISYLHFIDFIHIGESNAHGNGTDTYACSFSRMITAWRQIWNERTNSMTDIHFPFGFVQVGINQNHKNTFLCRLADELSFFL